MGKAKAGAALDRRRRPVKVKVNLGKLPPEFIPMTVTVKSKLPLVVPMSVRRKAGLRSGQEIEFKVAGGVINIIPKLPSADDEYTPEQRRIIDAQLAEGLADIKAGRTLGPFDSADEMIAHMKAQIKMKPAASKAKRVR